MQMEGSSGDLSECISSQSPQPRGAMCDRPHESAPKKACIAD